MSFSVPSAVVVRGVEDKSRTKLFGAVRTNKLIESIESGSQESGRRRVKPEILHGVPAPGTDL